MIYNNILELIGKTPLVKINKLNPNNQTTILAKLEFLNPSGSVKDRIALYMVEAAEAEDGLQPGALIVENTSGNTGTGLAMVASVKGYKVTLTIPDKMSQEKIDLMKAYGAETIITKTDVPAESPESYYKIAERIAKETAGSFYPDQYNNPKNIEAHYRTTGPEIWQDTDGRVDILIAGAGTGGTISGAARYLKEKNPKIKVICVDPVGSVFYDYFKTGKLPKPKVYKLEGIGEDKMVEALDLEVIDDFIQVNDKDSFLTARLLARQEGIFAGGSSGAALWVAQQIAKQQTEAKNIVVIFPDSGNRYLSKIYNDDWMKANGYL